MYDDDKLIAEATLGWKKSFSMGVVIPDEITNCNKCSKIIFRDDCDKLVNQNKEVSANLNDLKSS